ncbi:MAG TPA: hypothetical protein VE398_20645 [Acidobacteriota bacterium]|nr:hypothetical protein [Acidobacteriota bacterium]
MKRFWMIFAVAAVSLSFGAIQIWAQGPKGAGAGGTSAPKAEGTEDTGATHSGHSLNPIKWVKKDSKKTNHQLDANSDRDKELTSKLQAQGLIPAHTDLADACASFKGLSDCLAAIHASHNVDVNFNCLKWDVTGEQPKGDVTSCGTPGSSGMSLREAIQFLKPDAKAKSEVKTAEKQAHQDLK